VTDDDQPEADTTAIFRHRIRQTIAAAREKANPTETDTETEKDDQ
jgi:hypothetical protein